MTLGLLEVTRYPSDAISQIDSGATGSGYCDRTIVDKRYD